MIKLISALGLPLLLTGVFVLVEQVAPRGSPLPAPSEPVEQTALADPLLPPTVAEPAAHPDFGTNDPTAALDPWEFDPISREARRILDGLVACADSGAPVIPEGEIEALRNLLVRHPELADLFLEQRKDGSSRLRVFLTLAFYGVADPVLRESLITACKDGDPRYKRVNEVLADTSTVVAVLQGDGDPELRYELLGRMSKTLSAEPTVFAELRRIVDTDADPRITSRAITRLAKSEGEHVTGMLLAILRDPGRPIEDRQAAAGALKRRPGQETTKALLSIVENRGTDSLLRLAAQGLRTAWEDPRAREALLDLLVEEKADGQARISAVDSLVYCVRKLPEEPGNSLEGRICEHLTTLACRKGSEEVVVYGMSELSRAVGEPLRGNVLSIYKSDVNEELRQLFRADPALNRYLESP